MRPLSLPASSAAERRAPRCEATPATAALPASLVMAERRVMRVFIMQRAVEVSIRYPCGDGPIQPKSPTQSNDKRTPASAGVSLLLEFGLRHGRITCRRG